MNLKKCSKRKALYEKVLQDWSKLNLHSKSLIFITNFLLTVLVLNLFVDKLSHDTLSLFTSIILSMVGFLLGNNKKNKVNKDIYRLSENCNDEIKEYNFSYGNTIQIIFSIFLVLTSSSAIIFMDLNNNLNLFYFFKSLIFICTGFLLGESKINN
ncbi:hypothetical protein QJR60_08755 [Paraclostridium sordellii]|uniref:hypothetical protein n=1 Tax=Paraclostridium sordellii TaxID=1505 RepID=UPI0030CA8C0B